MKKKILKNRVIFTNTIVSFIVYFLIVLSQKNDSYPIGVSGIGRFPEWCYEFLFNNFLPNLFNMHPADFRSGGVLAVYFYL